MSKVLITGSSRGIGLATALAFARAGHEVYATMRHPDGAPELEKAARSEGLQIDISAMDVDSDESVNNGVSRILESAGHVDVLVNNAGIEVSGSIEEIPMDDIRRVMETNYFGPIRLIKALVTDMRERKSGTIINVASVAGKISSSPLTPYSATKFALEALSEGLAQELKPYNVRVAIVEPGIIDTAMAQRIGVIPEANATYPQAQRMARLFEASLQNGANPSIVADKILEIAESGTWKLRHPVGPDAEPFLAWRAGMTDEQWIDWNAQSDDDWYAAVEREFGLNVRPSSSSASG